MSALSGAVQVQFSVDASGASSIQKRDRSGPLEGSGSASRRDLELRRTFPERLYLLATFNYEGDKAQAEVRRAGMMLAASEASPTLGARCSWSACASIAHVVLTVSGACMEPRASRWGRGHARRASQRRPRLGDVCWRRWRRLPIAPAWCGRRGGAAGGSTDRAPTWDAAVGEPDLIASGGRGAERPAHAPDAQHATAAEIARAVAAAHLRARRRPSLRG